LVNLIEQRVTPGGFSSRGGAAEGRKPLLRDSAIARLQAHR
jgi:hypothetical protein